MNGTASSPADHKTVDGLVAAATKIVREYQGHPRTGLLRELAPVIVELRSRFTLQDGRPDWSGRSPEYREHMGDIYARAQVPADELDRLQSALRYHVLNLIHERAPKSELVDVGLITVKPKERVQNTRTALRAMREVVPPQDVERLTTFAQALLDYIDDAAVTELGPEDAAEARKALEAIQARTAELLRRLG